MKIKKNDSVDENIIKQNFIFIDLIFSFLLDRNKDLTNQNKHKSKTIYRLHKSTISNAHVSNNFKEIFINDFAPNWSNVSVCTQEGPKRKP